MYPPWWNDTVTLYNRKVVNGNVVTWKRTVLAGCYFDRVAERIRSTSGAVTLQHSDKLMVRIPQSSNFVSKAVWDSTTPDANAFTLSPEDIVVFGEVSDVIEEYQASHRSTDLVNRYKDSGVFVIQAVNINTKLESPHYFCEGAGYGR